MNRVNQEKIEDFNKWALLSFDHFENLRYADALTNMRKSGEVACKIILSFYKSKFDFSKKSLKELLSFIEKDNVIPKKIFNCLQTFQLYGNAASHDNDVSAKEAGYGIEALKIITNWIYVELLDEPIPFKIQSFLQVKDGSEKIKLKNTVKYLNEELINAKKATENLEIKLNAANATEAEKNKLNKELEEALSVIQKLETEITTNNIKEVAPKIPTIVSVNQDADLVPLETKINGKFLRKVLLISSLLLVVFFAIFYLFSAKKSEKSLVALNTLATDTSQLKVLVLPFRILQDNPNIDFKIETIITEKLSIRQDYGKSQINIIYNPKKDKTAISNKQAISINKLYNAEVILFGDVVENADGRGCKVILKYFLKSKRKESNPLEGLIEFEIKTGDEKGYDKVNNEIDCIIGLKEIDDNIGENKVRNALDILSKLKSEDMNIMSIASKLEFSIYAAMGNINKARETSYNYYNLYPDSLGAILNYAYSLGIKSDSIEKSKKMYEKAILLYPKNTTALISYASTLINKSHFVEAKLLAQKTIQLDPYNHEAYFQLGFIEYQYYKNGNEAKKYYIKSLELYEDYYPALKNLSFVYFNSREYQSSLDCLRKCLTADKNDGDIYLWIASIYQTSMMSNIDSSNKYLALSKRFINSDEVGSNIAEANAAFQVGDFEKAKKYYCLAYQRDSTINTIEPMVNLADIYKMEGNFNAAEKLLIHFHELDSNYEDIIFRLTYLYMNPDNPKNDPKKVLKFSLMGIRLLPSSENYLMSCADSYYYLGNTTEAEKYYRAAYDVNSNGFKQCYQISVINKENKNFIAAKIFIEKALKINSTSGESYAELGFIYLNTPYFDMELASANAQQAIDLSPNDYLGYYVMAIIYKNKRNLEEAEKFLNLAKKRTNLLDKFKLTELK